MPYLTQKQKNKLPRKLQSAIAKYRKGMQIMDDALGTMAKGGMTPHNYRRPYRRFYQTDRSPDYMPSFETGGAMYMGGGSMQYADGGLHKNRAAIFFGHNANKENYMNSPIHGRFPIGMYIGYPKNMYGGPAKMTYGGVDMPRNPYFTARYGFGGAGDSNYPQIPPRFGGYYDKLPTEADPYVMTGLNSPNRYWAMQMGGQMPMPQQAMPPQGMPQQGVDESGAHMANLVQGQLPPTGDQGMPQQPPQQDAAQQEQLMALAQAVLGGDQEALEVLQSLPPEIQAQVMAMIEQMQGGQGNPAMAKGIQPMKKGGKMIKRKRGGKFGKKNKDKNTEVLGFLEK